MKNIPSKLFLVIGTNEEQETDFNNLEHEYVCWSQDRTDESDIEYVSLSDRDQFAIGFAEWIRNEAPYIHAETIEAYYNHILWLYKQSLTKTDKA